VLRAADEDLGRTVALKFIPPGMHRAGAEERFPREARAASALDHVNIGTIFGIEETDDGRRFITMAYYEGVSLADRLGDGVCPMAPAEALLTRCGGMSRTPPAARWTTTWRACGASCNATRRSRSISRPFLA